MATINFTFSNKVKAVFGTMGVATLALSFLLTPTVRAASPVTFFNNAGSIPVNSVNQGEVSVCIDGTLEMNLIPFGGNAVLDLDPGSHTIAVTSLTRSSIDGSVIGACSTINQFNLITTTTTVLDGQPQDIFFSGNPTLLDPRDYGLYAAGSAISSLIPSGNIAAGTPRGLRVIYPDYLFLDGPERNGAVYGPLYQTAQFCMEANGQRQVVTGTLQGNSIYAPYAPQGVIPNNTDIRIYPLDRNNGCNDVANAVDFNIPDGANAQVYFPNGTAFTGYTIAVQNYVPLEDPATNNGSTPTPTATPPAGSITPTAASNSTASTASKTTSGSKPKTTVRSGGVDSLAIALLTTTVLLPIAGLATLIRKPQE